MSLVAPGVPAACAGRVGTVSFFFFCHGLFRLRDEGPARSSHGPVALKPVCPQARRGSKLGPVGTASSSTRSRGGSACWLGWSGAGHAQPRAVLVTACCTATPSMPHQRRDQPALAAVRRAGGARCARTRSRSRTKRCASPFQRPPTSDPSTTSRWGPPQPSSG